jgi:hypothetical protein
MDSSIELLGNSMNHSHIILTCLLFISSAAIAEDKPAPSLSQYDDGGASTPYSRMPHEVDKSPTNLYRNDYARTMDARIRYRLSCEVFNNPRQQKPPSQSFIREPQHGPPTHYDASSQTGLKSHSPPNMPPFRNISERERDMNSPLKLQPSLLRGLPP